MRKLNNMHLDSHGLPCQANGDCSDQLQRVGMIGVGNILNPASALPISCDIALYSLLQISPGVYSRFSGATAKDVTGDQLVPVFAYWTLTRRTDQLELMTDSLIMRLGFAQNVQKDNDPTVKTVPDFILLRTLPFLVRLSPYMYPVAFFTDILLILAAISCVLQADAQDTDDNNIVITLATCKAVMPTPLSLLACKIYKYFRKPPGPAGALRDYHAASTGGNPEIAELWVPIVEKL